MNSVNRRFVAMPDFLKLKSQRLKTLDVLTYVTIRSFHNSTTDQCYPSYEKIMERSGLSRGFIAQSIKRLEIAGYFSITHSKREGTCNQYNFEKFEHFQRIPYELFEATDLTTYEKAMLLCLRSLVLNDLLLYTGSIKSITATLELSYKQVYNPYRALVKKGYVQEKVLFTKSSTKGSIDFYLTDKIDWKYDYHSNPKPQKIEYFIKLKVA